MIRADLQGDELVGKLLLNENRYNDKWQISTEEFIQKAKDNAISYVRNGKFVRGKFYTGNAIKDLKTIPKKDKKNTKMRYLCTGGLSFIPFNVHYFNEKTKEARQEYFTYNKANYIRFALTLVNGLGNQKFNNSYSGNRKYNTLTSMKDEQIKEIYSLFGYNVMMWDAEALAILSFLAFCGFDQYSRADVYTKFRGTALDKLAKIDVNKKINNLSIEGRKLTTKTIDNIFTNSFDGENGLVRNGVWSKELANDFKLGAMGRNALSLKIIFQSKDFIFYLTTFFEKKIFEAVGKIIKDNTKDAGVYCKIERKHDNTILAYRKEYEDKFAGHFIPNIEYDLAKLDLKDISMMVRGEKLNIKGSYKPFNYLAEQMKWQQMESDENAKQSQLEAVRLAKYPFESVYPNIPKNKAGMYRFAKWQRDYIFNEPTRELKMKIEANKPKRRRIVKEVKKQKIYGKGYSSVYFYKTKIRDLKWLINQLNIEIERWNNGNPMDKSDQSTIQKKKEKIKKDYLKLVDDCDGLKIDNLPDLRRKFNAIPRINLEKNK